MDKRILVAIILFIVFGSIYFLVLNKPNKTNNFLNQNNDKYYYCEDATDCTLVQTGWCNTVVSINKEAKIEWLKEDSKHTEEARKNRQTCSLSTREYSTVENFSSSCINNKCEAKYNK